MESVVSVCLSIIYLPTHIYICICVYVYMCMYTYKLEFPKIHRKCVLPKNYIGILIFCARIKLIFNLIFHKFFGVPLYMDIKVYMCIQCMYMCVCVLRNWLIHSWAGKHIYKIPPQQHMGQCLSEQLGADTWPRNHPTNAILILSILLLAMPFSRE